MRYCFCPHRSGAGSNGGPAGPPGGPPGGYKRAGHGGRSEPCEPPAPLCPAPPGAAAADQGGGGGGGGGRRDGHTAAGEVGTCELFGCRLAGGRGGGGWGSVDV